MNLLRFDPDEIANKVLLLAVFFAAFRAYRAGPVTLSDGLYIAALLLLLYRRRVDRHPFGHIGSLWYIGFSMLAFGLTISTLIAGDAVRVLVVVGQYMLAYVVLAFLLLGHDYRLTINCIKAFILGNFVSNGCAVIWFHMNTIPDQFFVAGNGRLQAFMLEPNENGLIIGTCLPLLLYLRAIGELRLWSFVLGFCLLFYALLLTGSGNASLATAFGLTLYVLMTINFKTFIYLPLIVGACVLTIGIFGVEILPDIFEERVAGALTSGDIGGVGTAAHRVELIVEALEIVDDTIFFGLGIDQFRRISVQGAPVHNLYLLLFAEGGLIALLGWLIMIGSAAFAALAEWIPAETRREGAVAFSVTGVFALAAMNSAHLYGRYWLTAVFLGLAVALLANRARAMLRSQPRDAPEQG